MWLIPMQKRLTLNKQKERNTHSKSKIAGTYEFLVQNIGRKSAHKCQTLCQSCINREKFTTIVQCKINCWLFKTNSSSVLRQQISWVYSSFLNFKVEFVIPLLPHVPVVTHRLLTPIFYSCHLRRANERGIKKQCGNCCQIRVSGAQGAN